ncbi:uncharacterized protein LOC128213322 [Mya arenaria]|uniref:uncharacterized protein LOC128213322 n=1 Tax=Mya arenaria TaxID=6604 RepID=UPI0022E35F0B|nr:uncharacterized protein LOC128213322 [Mya arenaria]XP_052774886.1 uncharacterized protein LOC128213322 [Mya arenaria]
MLYVLVAILCLLVVRTQSTFYFRNVEPQCIQTCFYTMNIDDVMAYCDGDNSTCGWQCAAQRMGCDEGFVYHCAKDFQSHGYKEACAPEKYCNAGEEPYVTFPDQARSPRNAVINCAPCTDEKFYHSPAGQSSASYSRCNQQKFNRCIPEDNKIDCGVSWRERKETDGYCRCDARNGYAPENENVKTKCFYTDEFCVPKTCPHSSQEMLLNYTCGDRCLPGMHRTEESDECVPE